MRAILAHGGLPLDDPGSFRDGEAPDPQPGPHDLLVEVEAVSVNPVDGKTREAMSAGDPPRILGYDAAGTVRALGAEVQGFAVGDAVWYAGDITRDGSNAELQTVDARIAARRPTTLSAADAAALPLTSITAAESLFDRLRLGARDTGTLLLLGGAGGVGSALLQLARVHLPGIRVIATASRPQSRDWVRSLGAAAVIDHHDLVAGVREVAPGGVQYVFSTSSAGQIEAFAEVLAPFGHVVAIDEPPGLDLVALKEKSIAWHWELMFTRPMLATDDMARQGELLADLAARVDAGEIRSTATETIRGLDAAGIRSAHQRSAEGHTVGKIVVTR